MIIFIIVTIIVIITIDYYNYRNDRNNYYSSLIFFLWIFSNVILPMNLLQYYSSLIFFLWILSNIILKFFQVVPALAAGCCIILKPSELAPLSCLLLADMCTHAGECEGRKEKRGEAKRRGEERRFTVEKYDNIIEIMDIYIVKTIKNFTKF